MTELEKLFYALRTSMEREEEAKNMSVSAIKHIKRIVGPAINICNNDPYCKYTIKSFEVAIDQTQSGLVINVVSLTNRENGQCICGESLGFETSKSFKEKAGEILAKILEKPIRVVIDS